MSTKQPNPFDAPIRELLDVRHDLLDAIDTEETEARKRILAVCESAIDALESAERIAIEGAGELYKRERDELKVKLERALIEGELVGLSRAAGRVAELALVEFACRDNFARGLDRYYFHEAAGEALDDASEKLTAAAKALAEVLK